MAWDSKLPGRRVRGTELIKKVTMEAPFNAGAKGEEHVCCKDRKKKQKVAEGHGTARTHTFSESQLLTHSGADLRSENAPKTGT